MKHSEWQKVFIEKTFVENFLRLKPVEFYLRGIYKQLDKFQEIIQNNDEYTIDWNCQIIYE